MFFFRTQGRNVDYQRVNTGIVLNGFHDRFIQVIHAAQTNAARRSDDKDQANLVLHRVKVRFDSRQVLFNNVIVRSI